MPFTGPIFFPFASYATTAPDSPSTAREDEALEEPEDEAMDVEDGVEAEAPSVLDDEIEVRSGRAKVEASLVASGLPETSRREEINMRE